MTDFIAKAREESQAAREQLDREIALDRTQRFFGQRGRRDTDWIWSALVATMEHFWMAIFPFILFGGLLVLAVASWLGVSFMSALGGTFLLAVVVFSFAAGFR